MALIRKFVGAILLFLHRLTMPAKGKRSETELAQLKQRLRNYSIYQFEACPFCIKVRRELTRLNLPIELRDIREEPKFKDELIREGGRFMVPCLRIESEDGSTKWLYESSDIISYLGKEFPLQTSSNA